MIEPSSLTSRLHLRRVRVYIHTHTAVGHAVERMSLFVQKSVKIRFQVTNRPTSADTSNAKLYDTDGNAFDYGIPELPRHYLRFIKLQDAIMDER